MCVEKKMLRFILCLIRIIWECVRSTKKRQVRASVKKQNWKQNANYRMFCLIALNKRKNEIKDKYL